MLEGLVIVIVLFAATAFWMLDKERRRAIDRERELLAAVLSKNIDQYIAAIDNMKKQPKDKLAEMKLENELALTAAQLEQGQGVPVN